MNHNKGQGGAVVQLPAVGEQERAVDEGGQGVVEVRLLYKPQPKGTNKQASKRGQRGNDEHKQNLAGSENP
jgi:hypothetical protein